MSASLSLRGLTTLRHALAEVLTGPTMTPVPAVAGSSQPWWLREESLAGTPWLLTETSTLPTRKQATRDQATGKQARADLGGSPPGHRNQHGDADLAVSSAEDEATASRLIALVELARNGDKEAFGQLYDHYQPSVYRFLYYRVGSAHLAEDLTGETFFRALRSMNNFRWQGKDFGAWLMTIARNLAADHFKAGRTRLEFATEDNHTLDTATESPEGEVLASLTNETLLAALKDLPTEQRECLIMRFLQGLSIAETAELLGRSTGAVKQLQLRGVRNLAKLLPEGVQ